MSKSNASIINILGREYHVDVNADQSNFEDFEKKEGFEVDGLCLPYDKKIFIKDIEMLSADTKNGRDRRRRDVLLHELVHAFAYESGVNYDDDENLVDWIAKTIPKIVSAYESLSGGSISEPE